MEETGRISERISKIEKIINPKGKDVREKKFKLPFNILTAKGKLKKDYIVALILKTNGACEIKMLQIEDNTVQINEVYYETTSKHIFRYKKYPLIIIPEWNISPITHEPMPFDPEEDIDMAVREGRLSSAEKFILHAIKMDLVKQKMKINFGIILIVLAAVAGILVLLNYLKII